MLFLHDVEAEVEAAAALRATIDSAIMQVEERIAAAERVATAQIIGAILLFQAESGIARHAGEILRARWLAKLSGSKPRTAAQKQALLRAAELAVGEVRRDESAFREQLAAARAQTEEWRRRVQLARDVGDDELAAYGQTIVDEHERVAAELERELMTQTAAREALERRLTEARDRLAASPARQRVQ
ncbi:hypothetical protein [Polyangium spumosum]|uniref:Uncharacterized protein n=1 Tax=Polyangium spumosum TaxID=889282 RepID=A0A6N7Q3W5_9BACT|nr:hypothetical protein [Polyangium spumosum]MRG98397.1 hypothetical protein [Polyangium spumosum]